jgi:hypothetical protein
VRRAKSRPNRRRSSAVDGAEQALHRGVDHHAAQAVDQRADQRRAEAFVDLDAGEAETRAMLQRKRTARATL